jgi:hypothetical protein
VFEYAAKHRKASDTILWLSFLVNAHNDGQSDVMRRRELGSDTCTYALSSTSAEEQVSGAQILFGGTIGRTDHSQYADLRGLGQRIPSLDN